jgi:hypothetical protein
MKSRRPADTLYYTLSHSLRITQSRRPADTLYYTLYYKLSHSLRITQSRRPALELPDSAIRELEQVYTPLTY